MNAPAALPDPEQFVHWLRTVAPYIHAFRGKTLVVALADPLDISALDTLRARTGCKIVPLIAGASALARARALL